jgi:2',3'-cyclic-nucleotide 2'-phosphodiesterase (5'-nucleotidase family)
MNKKSIFSVMLVALLALSFAFASCKVEVEAILKVVNNYTEPVKVFVSFNDPIVLAEGDTHEYVYSFPSTGNYATSCTIQASSDNTKLGSADITFDEGHDRVTVTVNADGTVTKK